MAKVCQVIIERSMTSWVCDLELDHDGPDMAHGDAKSMRERAEWVEAQAALESPQEPQTKLSAFQGEPQTTAQRYTENATDHPAVVKAQKEDAANAKMCKPCFAGKHLECVQRAEWVAVTLYDKPRVEAWCSCFQQDKVAHGAGEDTGGDSPAPEPETLTPSKVEGLKQQVRETMLQPEPTKQRPGDQVLPRPTGRESVQERMIEKARVLHDREGITDEELGFIEDSLEVSIKVGTERYGSPLQTFNGRRTLQDLEDEARDTFVYVSALNQAAQASRGDVIGLCEDAVKAANAAGSAMGLTQVVTIVVDTIMGAVGTLSNIEWGDS